MAPRASRGLRVFVGPIEIAGYYARLAAILREHDVQADAIDLAGHVYRYETPGSQNFVVRLATTATVGYLRNASRRRAVRLPWRLFQVASRVPLLVWALARYDAFVFSFGQSLLGGLELPLLKLARKRLIFVFNGTDARPPYVDGVDMSSTAGRSIDQCISLARRKKTRIRRIERYADAVVSQPAFSHFFERPVYDFFRVGLPWTPPDVAHRDATGATIRIAHSPSHPEVKGSALIRAAVEEVRSAGHDLEFVELQGVPNAVIRREILEADFVIDQLYSDAPMVGFATEAAVAGRPAIVGGYVWPELDRIYSGGAMPPVEACHPDRLGQAITKLVTDADYRRGLGDRARAFVETTWSREAIASRYVDLLAGGLDPDYLFDPRTIRYVAGVGLSEARAREIVAAVIARGGREALQLADKPELEQAFVDFAEGRLTYEPEGQT